MLRKVRARGSPPRAFSAVGAVNSPRHERLPALPALPCSATALSVVPPAAGHSHLCALPVRPQAERASLAPAVGGAARVQALGLHRQPDGPEGRQAVPPAVAELPEQRGREERRLER